MIVDEITRLLPEINASIDAKITRWYGPHAERSGPPEIQLRAWSFFLRYTILIPDDRSLAILVKFRRFPTKPISASINDPVLKEECLRDFHAIQAVERLIIPTGLTSPKNDPTSASMFMENEKKFYCAIRPVEFLNEWSALVMEELEAVPLRKNIKDLRSTFDPAWQSQLEAFYYRSARWLRVFHEQLGDLHDGPFFSDEIHSYLKEKLQFIAANLRYDFSWLLRTLDKAREEYQQQTLPHALLHNDFHSSNILISKDKRVVVLDFHFIEGPSYLDLTKLMTDLQTYSLQVLFNGLYIRPAFMKRLHRSILHGYFGSDHYNEAALQLYNIYSIIDKWRFDEETLNAGKRHSLSSQAVRLLAVQKRNFFLKLLKAANRLLLNQLEPDTLL